MGSNSVYGSSGYGKRRTVLMVGVGVATIAGSAAAQSDPFSSLPSTRRLTGVVRDFRDQQTAGGHPDFNMEPADGKGVYMGIVADDLGTDGNPVFLSRGRKCATPWRDARDRHVIGPKPYIAHRHGDS